MASDPLPADSWRTRARNTLDLIRANPTGRLALRVFIGSLGGLIVLIGLVLVPLPGPGWLIVVLGLGVLAVEFVWARHVLAFTKARLHEWTTWIGRQSLPIRLTIGLVGLLFVAAVAYLTLRISLGSDFLTNFWTLLTSN